MAQTSLDNTNVLKILNMDHHLEIKQSHQDIVMLQKNSFTLLRSLILLNAKL